MAYFLHINGMLASDDTAVDPRLLRNKLDENLKELNDDYAVERKSALKDISVKVLPRKSLWNLCDLKGKKVASINFPGY